MKEEQARKLHASGHNCAFSVYEAFTDVNKNVTVAPRPRSEGGKCGAVLAAEQIIREMNGDSSMFDEEFLSRYGSLKCGGLRGKGPSCNDYVGAAAEIVEKLIQ